MTRPQRMLLGMVGTVLIVLGILLFVQGMIAAPESDVPAGANYLASVIERATRAGLWLLSFVGAAMVVLGLARPKRKSR